MTNKTPEKLSRSISIGSENNDPEVGFDSRDLDHTVIERLKQSEDFEAQMIANFNAKVNSQNHHQKVSKLNFDDSSETGGPSGLEPTRYGDWERKGRCYDF